jgi:hypothetical protein
MKIFSPLVILSIFASIANAQNQIYVGPGDSGTIALPVYNYVLDTAGVVVGASIEAPPQFTASAVTPISIAPGTTSSLLIDYQIDPNAVVGTTFQVFLTVTPNDPTVIPFAGSLTLGTTVNISINGPPGPPSVNLTAAVGSGGDPDLYQDFSGIATAADAPSTIIGFSTTTAAFDVASEVGMPGPADHPKIGRRIA